MDILSLLLIYYFSGIIINVLGIFVIGGYNSITGNGMSMDELEDMGAWIMLDILLWPINSVLGLLIGLKNKHPKQILFALSHIILPIQLIIIIAYKILQIYIKIKDQ